MPNHHWTGYTSKRKGGGSLAIMSKSGKKKKKDKKNLKNSLGLERVKCFINFKKGFESEYRGGGI